jgi:tetratricopeptide (TPR) repeat protein
MIDGYDQGVLMTRRHTLLLLIVTAVSFASLAYAQESTGVVVSVDKLVEGMSCLEDPSQTYTLFLPSGYSNEKKYPVLLIFDNQGRSKLAAELFEPAAREWGWILISSNDVSDDVQGPDAVSALVPEIRKRFAADSRRIYAAGFDVGGQVAYLLAKDHGEMAGVIISGSRLLPDQIQDASFAVFAAVGNLGTQFYDMKAMDDLVADLGNSHRFEVFDGGDDWMPVELASTAVAWLEIEAMRNELRPREPQLIRRHLDSEMQRARDLAQRGEAFGAYQHYDLIVRTYTEIADTSEAQVTVRRLEDDELVRDAIKQEEKLREFEQRNLEQFVEAFTEFRDDETAMQTTRLRRKLGVSSLERKATKDDDEAAVARRLLEIAYSQAVNDLAQEMLNSRRYGHARAVFELATSLFADRPDPWFGLTVVHAQLGNLDGALDALASAVERGFDQIELLDSESRLDPLREIARFRELATEIRAD